MNVYNYTAINIKIYKFALINKHSHLQSTLSNSSSLRNSISVSITKILNHRASNYRGFCKEIFKGPEHLVRISVHL